MCRENPPLYGRFAVLILKGLPRGKGFATHRRDSIEGAKAMDICNAAHGDRIAQIANLAHHVGKRRPRRKTLAIRIA